ncbi:Calcium/calmodulin-dependent protein kinase type 1D, partial [Nowakowskiella sp. JEL0078]
MKKLFGFKKRDSSVETTGKISPNDIDNFYFIGKTLGSGSFGAFICDVRIATRKVDSLKFAVKCIDKTKLKEKELNSLLNDEISVLQKIKHKNVVSLVEKFESKSFIYLVTDLAMGGELFDQIVAKGFYSEKDAGGLVKQLLDGIEYLHSMNIVHRDLKPENLLFADKTPTSTLLITDFGLSKAIGENELLTTACGTPGYVSPEILKRSGHGKPVDMWSIG